MFLTKRRRPKQLLYQLTAMILIVLLLVSCGGKTTTGDEMNDKGANSESQDIGSDNSGSPATVSDNSGSPAIASESYSAYIQAKGELLTRLSDALASNPETAFSSMSLLGISMVDLALLPASSFGLGEASANMALGFLRAEDIVYSENGNQYSVKYKGEDGSNYELQGEYDKSADALKCTSLVDGKETLTSEHRKTSYGYVSQTYVVNDDGSTYVYQLTATGNDGVVGMSKASEKPSSLTGSESIDFPKECQEWYAIDGNKVTGVTADGNEISFDYTPSEDGE
ncbi:MAG TPA: hypothetical protein GX017_04600 [Clostridiales bacterium]|nr:hypothetical protein [Clostridiales bacterium]